MGLQQQQAEQDGVEKAIINWVNYLHDKLVTVTAKNNARSRLGAYLRSPQAPSEDL